MPPPGECRAAPRSIDELRTLLGEAGTPAAGRDSVKVDSTIPVPLGKPADRETVDGVLVTVREVVACFNAGDVTRAMSLFTGDGLRRTFGAITIRPSGEGPAGTPVGAPEGASEGTPAALPADLQVRLIVVSDVSALPDGRIAAFVVLDDPRVRPRGPGALLLVFRQDGGRWRIDQMVDFTMGRVMRTATPTRGNDQSDGQ